MRDRSVRRSETGSEIYSSTKSWPVWGLFQRLKQNNVIEFADCEVQIMGAQDPHPSFLWSQQVSLHVTAFRSG